MDTGKQRSHCLKSSCFWPSCFSVNFTYFEWLNLFWGDIICPGHPYLGRSVLSFGVHKCQLKSSQLTFPFPFFSYPRKKIYFLFTLWPAPKTSRNQRACLSSRGSNCPRPSASNHCISQGLPRDSQWDELQHSDQPLGSILGQQPEWLPKWCQRGAWVPGHWQPGPPGPDLQLSESQQQYRQQQLQFVLLQQLPEARVCCCFSRGPGGRWAEPVVQYPSQI